VRKGNSGITKVVWRVMWHQKSYLDNFALASSPGLPENIKKGEQGII
jgi:hypothetical protein